MVELMYRTKAFLNVLDTSSIRFCKASLIGSFPLRNRKAIVSLPFTMTSYNGSFEQWYTGNIESSNAVRTVNPFCWRREE